MGACAVAFAACGLLLGTLANTVVAAPGTQPASPDHLVVRSVKVMGTRVTVSLWTSDEARGSKAIAEVFAEFGRVDRLMTSWLPNSGVSRINAAAGLRAVAPGAEVLKLLERSLLAARRTSGAFDITVGAFRGLWKFDQDRDGSIPTAAAVKARLGLVGYKGIRLRRRGKVMLKRKGMRITLGGIAKGYAVDRAVAILRKRNLTNFILQAGGDLYASGRKGARQWRVGIRDPRGQPGSVFALASIENMTFSTSGDYERSVVKNGVRYHHILDPETGYPASRSRSVTVMAKDALTADVWSTALFVIGPKKGLPLIEKMNNLDAVWVDNQNRLVISSGLKHKLIVIKQPSTGI